MSLKLPKQSLIPFNLLLLLVSGRAVAQIIPDQTLPHNSLVTPQGNILVIEGGTARRGNLFHSFEAFSVLRGQEAFFNNASNIQNILTRVTGSSISQIGGLLRANGTANLFFLNPNGIIFGKDASLNLGGSFLASTAGSLKFADGSNFSTQPSSGSPLLTISTPVALEFGSQSGDIRVQGTGGNLILLDPNPFFSPFITSGPPRGLQVALGQSLALVGGNIILEGGRINSLGGRIELGSVESGTVGIDLTPRGLKLDYTNEQSFLDIQLLQSAFLDASGGVIAIQGRKVELRDGSVIALQNLGPISGEISIKASESLQLGGTAPDGILRSAIVTETLGLGPSGPLEIFTKNLTIEAGAVIGSRAFGPADGSNIEIQADNSVQISGVSPINPSFSSSITAITLTSGKAGDITIDTNKLSIAGGGFISSGTFSSGQGGDLTLNAADIVELIGVDPTTSIQSTLAATTLNSGDAGNLTINTAKLKVLEGARIDSSTLGTGNAGNLVILASDSLEVSGTAGNSSIPSSIISSADFLEPELQQLFNIGPVLSGDSGNIEIKANRLTVASGGIISVENEGSGNAGNLSIDTASILVEDLGSLRASTQSGEGGNITINSEVIILNSSGRISATAGGTGNGGNIALNTESLFVLDSAITAEAFKGRGGNIDINASQFALISPDSLISASSQLGIDGEVRLNTDSFQIQNLTSLPVNFSPEVLLSRSCFAGKPAQVSFIWQGPGGLPLESEVGAFSIPLPETPAAQQGVSLRPPQGMRLAKRLVRTEDGRLFLLGDGGDLPASVGAGQRCDG